MRLLLLPMLAVAVVAAAPSRTPVSGHPPGRAETPRAALVQAPSHEGFEQAWARLKAGRAYTKQPIGRRDIPSTVNGVRLHNIVEIPADYDPDRTWPLRVSLHGGVSRPVPGPGQTGHNLTNRTPASQSEIVMHPEAWEGSEWWTAGQVENVLRILDEVKRTYNVDESRVYLTGISDGGTGVYFFAMRAPTPWASCLPLNGHPVVLANPDVGADGELFAGNLVNCPLYLVNGGRDPLYPAASVAPLVAMMRRAGAEPVFHVHQETGHDTSWWPEERPLYEEFVRAHPRAAHPDRLSWETELTDRYNRVRWLVIDRLGKRASDTPLEDVNSFEIAPARQMTLYARSRPAGRVDIVRRGNAFEAKTRGVSQFTLLLSPDVVDFAQRVQVTVNGMVAFNGTVTKDVSTLLKWAARDDDRTMLYGAELKITVP